MSTRRFSFLIIGFISVFALLFAFSPGLFGQSPDLSKNQTLGKSIFFDENLSIERNQSCASCHAPESGWTGPNTLTNAHGAVYEGSITGRFGNRKPPSAAYATQSPILHIDEDGTWEGGNFWDGRATGQKLGNPAADQAQGPFLNPAEQALPDSACVVYRVCNGAYPIPFTSVWGPRTCTIAWPADVEQSCRTEGAMVQLSSSDRARSDRTYNRIARSIAAYEGSREVNAFTSKFDYVLKGKAQFTSRQLQGFALFQGKGKCANCHISTEQGAIFLAPPPLFTDYTFDNLGVPRNLENPVYNQNPGYIDVGLGGYLKNIGLPVGMYEPQAGKVKVPTLRNVDKRPYPGFVKAFGHNGYFKSLEEVVHFYNARDVLPTCLQGDPGEKVTCWPAPEHPENVNRTELGNLGLTPAEEGAIVEFLRILSDGYRPK